MSHASRFLGKLVDDGSSSDEDSDETANRNDDSDETASAVTDLDIKEETQWFYEVGLAHASLCIHVDSAFR